MGIRSLVPMAMIRLLTQVVLVAGTAAVAIAAYLAIGTFASIPLREVHPLKNIDG